MITTSTGTTDAARVRAARVSGVEVAVAALLLSAQYPTVPLPGPRMTTWPAIRTAMLAGSVQPVPSKPALPLLKLPKASRPTAM